MVKYYTINNVGQVICVSEINAPSNARYSIFYIQDFMLPKDISTIEKIVREYFDIVKQAFGDMETAYFFNTNDVLKNILQLIFKVNTITILKVKYKV